MLVKLTLWNDSNLLQLFETFPAFYSSLTELKRKRGLNTINERSVEDGTDKQSQSSRGALPISFTTT